MSKKKVIKPVYIEPWGSPHYQMCTLGNNHWSVARLFELAKNLEVMVVPLRHLNIYHKYKNLTLREITAHMQAVNAADLKYPIILDEDGDLMDGRHRIMKCLLNSIPTIKVVRFDTNPSPCKHDAGADNA